MKLSSLRLTRTTIRAALQRGKTRLGAAFGGNRVDILAPEAYHGPTPEELLAQDGKTRLLLLFCLNGVSWADSTFLTTFTSRASEDQRHQSLTWLLEHDCISTHQQWLPRTFFWGPRKMLTVYSLTPVGATLLTQWRTAAQAGCLSTSLEDPAEDEVLATATGIVRSRRHYYRRGRIVLRSVTAFLVAILGLFLIEEMIALMAGR